MQASAHGTDLAPFLAPSISLPMTSPPPVSNHPTQPLDAAAIRRLVNALCRGEVLARSRRSRELLLHLVEHGLLGGGEPLKELAIGLTVFKRDAAQYHPGIDPIVRVEVGRLRQRLARHYARAPRAPGWRLDLPPGSYVPVLQWVANSFSLGLSLAPLVCHSSLPTPQGFTRLLNGYLRHHLQAHFGPVGRLGETADSETMGALSRQGASYLLEGHVRASGDYFSTTLELWTPGSGHQLWSSVVTVAGAPDEAHLQALCRACTAGIQAALG